MWHGFHFLSFHLFACSCNALRGCVYRMVNVSLISGLHTWQGETRTERRKCVTRKLDGLLVVSSQNHEPPSGMTVPSNIPDLSLSVHTFHAHTR